MRVVLIAEDERDADRWVEQQPELGRVDVLWVSPHGADRARGMVADAVLVTDNARLSLSPASFQRLLVNTLPCVMSGGTGS